MTTTPRKQTEYNRYRKCKINWSVTFGIVVRICCVSMRRVCRQHFSIRGIDAVNCVCGWFGCYLGIRYSVFVFVSTVFVAVIRGSRHSVAFGSFAIYYCYYSVGVACQSLDCYGNMCNCPYFCRSLYRSLPVLNRYQCSQYLIIHPFHIHRHHLGQCPNPMHIPLDRNHRLECRFLFHKCNSHRIYPSVH